MAFSQDIPVAETGAWTQDQNNFSFLLSTALAQASYAPELQRQYFSFFTTQILPYLKYIPFFSYPAQR
jgi:hypothetical protein